jgi:hypothetical protein
MNWASDDQLESSAPRSAFHQGYSFFLNHLISILQMVETVCLQFGGFTMQSFTLQYPTSAKKMWKAIKLL